MTNESSVQLQRTLFDIMWRRGQHNFFPKYMVSIYRNPRLRMDHCFDSLCEMFSKWVILLIKSNKKYGMKMLMTLCVTLKLL
jgi:hypothetical protein